MRKVLAFDFGASSGRAILGIYNEGKLVLEEIHRFVNQPVRLTGHMYWDVLRLLYDIKLGIIKCVNAGHGDIEAIGIDTWGVDYGLIDKKGELIGNPYHYRDVRTVGMAEKVEGVLGKDLIYSETGIQTMELNTIYQLASGEIPITADKLLFTPDLLAYFLTGQKRCERTILSTSQMLNPHKGELSQPILDGLGIDKDLFCDLIEPGDIYGNLLPEIAEECGISALPVVSVATHDTASAVVAVPFGESTGAYLSCGTWSLLGIECDKPLINADTQAANFTNEGGFGGTIRFLKNIIGLWLVQECINKWAKEGENVDFAVLDKEVLKVEPFVSYINPDDPVFLAPRDMPSAIVEYCKATQQKPPATKAEFLMLITQSLAMKYRKSVELLERLSGKKFDVIHMVGGGIKDKLLCQFTANATGKTVVAGPVEATAAGNILVQLMALGSIDSVANARDIVKNSLKIIEYTPTNCEKWAKEYERFIKQTEEL